MQQHMPSRGGCIIVTSRLSNVWGNVNGVEKNIVEMTPQEAGEMLYTITGETDKAAREELAKLLGCIPLVVNQASAWIQVMRLVNECIVLGGIVHNAN